MLLFWFYSVLCLFTHNGPLLLIRNESPDLHRFSDTHVSYNVVRLRQWLERSLKQPWLAFSSLLVRTTGGLQCCSEPSPDLSCHSDCQQCVFLSFFFIEKGPSLKLFGMWSPLTDTGSFGVEEKCRCRGCAAALGNVRCVCVAVKSQVTWTLKLAH